MAPVGTPAAARSAAARRLPGQRWRAPPPGDADRARYEAMLRRNPSSKLAVPWCIEHGVLPAEEVERLWPLYVRLTGGAGRRHPRVAADAPVSVQASCMPPQFQYASLAAAVRPAMEDLQCSVEKITGKLATAEGLRSLFHGGFVPTRAALPKGGCHGPNLADDIFEIGTIDGDFEDDTIFDELFTAEHFVLSPRAGAADCSL